MNFTEVSFWIVLVTGLALIVVARLGAKALWPKSLPVFERACLAALSLALLLGVGAFTFLVFLTVVLGTYVACRYAEGAPWPMRRAVLLLVIPLQLTPILYFKYADFLCNGVLRLEYPGVRNLLIPVGISFYTFQMLSFLVDTLVRGQAVPPFIDFLNFISFFPQIVAGPIERRDDLLPQVERFRFRWSAPAIDRGVPWIVLGLFLKCCLADNLAQHFSRTSTANPYLIWLANVLFGLRIYFDFAGYSLIAMGLGLSLGIQLTLNFASPYCSTNVTEFWRRWHVSLSQWFRDYVYVPLGGGRVPFWALNIALVFVVSGLWHGAGWNFILWGVLHGAFLIGHRKLGRAVSIPTPLAWVLTMGFTFFAWLSFYETRTDALLAKIRTLLQPSAYGATALREAIHTLMGPDALVLTWFLAMACAVLALEWLSVRRKNEPYYYLRRPAVACVLVTAAMLLTPGANNSFIYFAF